MVMMVVMVMVVMTVICDIVAFVRLISDFCVLRSELVILELVVVVFIIIVLVRFSIRIIWRRSRTWREVVELSEVACSVHLDRTRERTGSERKRDRAIGRLSPRLMDCVGFELFVISFVQDIELFLDIRLLPTANGAAARMPLLLLHLAEDGLLFDLQQVTTLALIELKPEITNVLSLFRRVLSPDLCWLLRRRRFALGSRACARGD
jgi:hypothetical protein